MAQGYARGYRPKVIIDRLAALPTVCQEWWKHFIDPATIFWAGIWALLIELGRRIIRPIVLNSFLITKLLGSVRVVSKLSVIVPAHNEEEQIVRFLHDTLSSLDALGFDYEVVVVDDGSTDRTRERAISAANSPRVKVVGYDHNVGKGFALKYGFAHSSGDIVMFVDSEGDISPMQIVRYVGAAEQADVVIASKWHRKSRTEMPSTRRFLSHRFRLMVMLLTGLRVSDTQSGMKAFRTRVLERVLPKLAMKRFAFEATMEPNCLGGLDNLS